MIIFNILQAPVRLDFSILNDRFNMSGGTLENCYPVWDETHMVGVGGYDLSTDLR